MDWSEHIQRGVKDPKLPGPDGIGTISPLVSTGLISPEYAPRTVATFTGGFKRYHGAFKYGELASKNYGTHYGFLENGVLFSKLQPGLATIFVLDDGSIQMKTWEAQDDQLLAKIKYARQNGVPLVEFDERSQSTVPGQLVNKWGPGNWSGSEDMSLRTSTLGHRPAEEWQEALPDLCRVLGCNAFCDGSRIPGIPIPLRNAPGHERSGAHLLRALSTLRIATGRGPPHEWNESSG